MKKMFFLLVLILSISACKSLDQITQKLRELNPLGSKVEFVIPAESLELLEYKDVVFEANDKSLQLAHNIKKIMSNTMVQNKPYFDTLLLNPLATESGLRASVSLVDITNELTNSRETRIKCPGKKIINTCKSSEGYEYQVACTIRTVNASGSLNASDNNLNVLQTFKSVSNREKVCSDGSSSLPSLQSQIKETVEQLSVALISAYIPSIEERPSDLHEPDFDTFPEMELQYEQAEDLLHSGKTLQSLQLFEALYSQYPNSPELIFDLAYTYQAYGEYEKAEKLYARINSVELQADVTKYRAENNAYLKNSIKTITR